MAACSDVSSVDVLPERSCAIKDGRSMSGKTWRNLENTGSQCDTTEGNGHLSIVFISIRGWLAGRRQL